ncbi:M48 family metallopeptidase [Coraliomargarita sp. SDUM461004]|uniref:M48 family metallopeptidase n=1 Tax=Thalassobacterium sedimentorum TaxID=3041258 RepID=A0ABU1ALH5_9BACT|nr:M48 family metallopeptidase [Coraliomargarita sp. SDUM461004]MDQ8194616.1 M48 family metallopeptidase [Coraliomargarita sp. SDUM461004]
MDFFEAQELARKRTRLMLVLFAMAVISIAIALYGIVAYVAGAGFFKAQDAVNAPITWWQPDLFLGTLGAVILLVSACSLFKVAQLRSGGGYVARSMGGIQIEQTTQNADERVLMNIVEEMSIASGVPMPDVYLLPEDGINAFAAGFSPADAVVAVTRGCIRTLNRDELQGVVAHEFSHILNGDMRLNIRLMGVLFGILAIAVLGQLVFRSTAEAGLLGGGRRRGKDGGGAMIAIILIGIAVMAIGYIGVFFGRLIQSAISRQREFLADAAAVQFTRNPEGIAGALKKIGGTPLRGAIANAHSQEAAHFFFANALKSRHISMFATHPPLEQRITAIEPSWDGRFVTASEHSDQPQSTASSSKPPKTPMQAHDFINSIGQISAAAILTAQEIHGQIEKDLNRLHQSRNAACAVLIGLQISASAKEDDSTQLSLVKTQVDAAIYRETADWLPRLRVLDLNQRFALFDVALPMAAARDLNILANISDLIRELAHSDGSIELEELALLRGVAAYLSARQAPSRQVKPLPPAQMEMPICVLLSAISYTASAAVKEREAAFQAGARKCNRYLLKQSILLPEEDITFEALEAALDLFSDLPLPQKKIIFEGALSVVLEDGRVAQDELSLVRIIATNLNLPMPPLISK